MGGRVANSGGGVLDVALGVAQMLQQLGAQLDQLIGRMRTAGVIL
jgi:hypothetical protein